jgi:restriction endonuclease S subunit
MCKTSELADLIRGVTYQKHDARKGESYGFKPILRANNINGTINQDDLVFVPASLISETQHLQEGDILFAMSSGSRNLVGKSARVNKALNAGFGAFCGVVRPSSEISSKFLFWFFQTRAFRNTISEASKGSGINNLKREHLLNHELPLPPLVEQKRIVAKIEELFSEIDAGEENLRLARRQLNMYRQSLLKQAFDGKLSNSSLAEKVPLSTLITELSQGWSPKCELNREPEPNEWAVIKTTAIQHCRYNDSEAKPLPASFKPRTSIEIKDGDFLMTRKGPRARAGVTCYVRQTRPKLMICDTVYRFRCIENRINPLYLELALNSPNVLRAIDQRKAGISESGLSLTHTKIGTLEIPLCSLDEQQEILRLLDGQLEMIERNTREIDEALRKSETLRQSVLKKAFSGHLVTQEPANESATELLVRIRKKGKDASRRVTNPMKSPESPKADLFPELISSRKKPSKTDNLRRQAGKTDLQAGIVALAIDRFGRRNQFLGHTNAEKIVHLADYLADLELDRQPMKDVAGPNDFKRAKQIEHRARMKGWFTVSQKGAIYNFHAGRNMPALLESTQITLGTKFEIIENLLQKLSILKNTRAIEIFATVYAAWNNLLLLKKSTSNEAIVTEARENWHARKLEIPRERFFKAIDWMKKNDFVPKGKGHLVEKPQEEVIRA